MYVNKCFNASARVRAGKTEWAHALAGGLSVCEAKGSVARSDTVPEAVIIGKTKKNKYKIWFWTYIIIAVLLAAELLYFRIADRCNIIDKPNERSSHSSIVLRGGGIIFAISMIVWMIWQMVQGEWGTVQGYLPFMVGLIMICTVSFWDEVHSLPDSLRMVVQILSILLMFWSVGLFSAISPWWLMAVVVVVALFFCVGATNLINFMDGINGITVSLR